MANRLKVIVDKRLKELGLNPFEAARRGELERSFINDIIIGKKQSFRSDKAEQLARALQFDPQDFAAMIATPVPSPTVPIMGYLGAGAEVEPEFEQVPPEGLDQVDLPFPVPDDMIAFKVKGTSMLPVYKPDHIIIVYREQRKPLESFYGLEAAVRTDKGRRYVKTIERGVGGTFLRSWNDMEPIGPVSLEWIGEIFVTMPPAALRKVERQGGIQGQLRLR